MNQYIASTTGAFTSSEGNMSGSLTSFARTARAISFAAASMAAVTAPAKAGDFTLHQCKVIGGTALEVVKVVGKEKLSMEFRQSFRNWLGNVTCDGPKEITIMSSQDSVTFGTIRAMLLAGSHPISLEKVGVHGVMRETVGSATPPVRKRSDAKPAPTMN